MTKSAVANDSTDGVCGPGDEPMEDAAPRLCGVGSKCGCSDADALRKCVNEKDEADDSAVLEVGGLRLQ